MTSWECRVIHSRERGGSCNGEKLGLRRGRFIGRPASTRACSMTADAVSVSESCQPMAEGADISGSGGAPVTVGMEGLRSPDRSTFRGFGGGRLSVGWPLCSPERLPVVVAEKKKTVPTSKTLSFVSVGSLCVQISITIAMCPRPTMTAVMTRFRMGGANAKTKKGQSRTL
jgi:hypothetical protein